MALRASRLLADDQPKASQVFLGAAVDADDGPAVGDRFGLGRTDVLTHVTAEVLVGGIENAVAHAHEADLHGADTLAAGFHLQAAHGVAGFRLDDDRETRLGHGEGCIRGVRQRDLDSGHGGKQRVDYGMS